MVGLEDPPIMSSQRSNTAGQEVDDDPSDNVGIGECFRRTAGGAPGDVGYVILISDQNAVVVTRDWPELCSRSVTVSS
jgi:hypothetical protein